MQIESSSWENRGAGTAEQAFAADGIPRRSLLAIAVLLVLLVVCPGPVDSARAGPLAQATAGAPALLASSYLGGAGRDFARDVALAPNGDIIVVGTTGSPDFPTRAVASLHRGGRSRDDEDAFVVRVTPDATAIVWSLTLGGSGDDTGASVSVDPAGTIVVVGAMRSRDFPTARPLQPALAGQSDVFVTALAPDGSLLFSTYLGGSGADGAEAIAHGPAGTLYLTGSTESPDFPTRNAYDPLFRGDSCSTYEYERRCEQTFVTSLSGDGQQLRYSTFLGGARDDHGAGIAVDAEGGAYLTGDTSSSDFPTAQAFQRGPGGSLLDRLLHVSSDSFVARLSPDGRRLVYSTYLGGAGWDSGSDIALDLRNGDVVVVGVAGSDDFPATFHFGAPSGNSAFIARIAPNGGLQFSAQLGGNGATSASGLALDQRGDIVLIGSTQALDFPHVNAVQRMLQQGDRNDRDAFVAVVAADGATLRASTFLGGRSVDTDGDGGRAVLVGRLGQVIAVGTTSSSAALARRSCRCPGDERVYEPPSDFPLAQPFQPAHAGGFFDAFIAELRLDGGAELPLAAQLAARGAIPPAAVLLVTTLLGVGLVMVWWRRRAKRSGTPAQGL